MSEVTSAGAAGPRHVAAKGPLHRRERRRSPWLLVLVAVDLLAIGAIVNWFSRPRVNATTHNGWSLLDPQARCSAALGLVRHADPWLIVCQWRIPGQLVEGEAFPPPAGDPPWDRPRIVIYVDPNQTRVQVARVIAHEMGHMYLTRTASDGPAWLRARGLAPETPATEWVEDYAEVFAAVYGPDVHDWRGMGARPSPAELRDLAAQFFHEAPVSLG